MMAYDVKIWCVKLASPFSLGDLCQGMVMLLNFRRFLLALFVAALMVPHAAEAARHKKSRAARQPPDRFAEIVIDANTGYVFSEKNADKRLYPASLSKMMTLYLTFEALDEGSLKKNQRLSVSRRASRQEPSSLGLSEGETIRTEDCIMAVTTKSANDCAVVLAEAVGGSEPYFGSLMTAKAQQLGMRNTHFVNASGLFNSMQYSSARDMAILAQALIRDHPRHYHYFGLRAFSYKGDTFLNHNKLMNSYRGMDGLKTGYVYASGYNLAASAVRNGTRLIGVVFGGRTAVSRNNAMAQLLNQAFNEVNSGPRVAATRTQQVQLPGTATPSPRPVLAENDTARLNPAAGLHIDQGDTSDTGIPVAALQPQLLNTTPLAEQSQPGGAWAIQVGAFSSHSASRKALMFARSNLNGVIPTATDSIAPLMTQRGMIYRARLSGLGRDTATAACRVLKGHCLVLAVE